LSTAKSGNVSSARNGGPGFHFVQSGLRLLAQKSLPQPNNNQNIKRIAHHQPTET